MLPNSDQVARLTETLGGARAPHPSVDGRTYDTDRARDSAMISVIGTAATRKKCSSPLDIDRAHCVVQSQRMLSAAKYSKSISTEASAGR